MAKTGCAGSAISVAPICLNFGITAPVLSCVITWRGRIETKSPARTTLPAGSPSACLAAIFSTSVRPISISFGITTTDQMHDWMTSQFLAIKAFEQLPSLLYLRQARRQRRLHHFAGAFRHLRAHDETFLTRERHQFIAHQSLDSRRSISHSRQSCSKHRSAFSDSQQSTLNHQLLQNHFLAARLPRSLAISKSTKSA